MMRFVAIVGLGVAAGVLFGLVQSGITAAVSGFDPTGLIAHSVIGLVMGLGLATAARVGSRPKRSGPSLVKPVVLLMVGMGVFAVAAGAVGFTLGRSGNVMLPAAVKEQIPPMKWPEYQGCALASQASYNVACVGGGMLVAWVWVSRRRLHPKQVAAG